MKTALVLSGGGSRGAYEIGAWQALEGLNVHFDGVYGTSIGALNAALVAQGDLDKAIEIWEDISVRQVVAMDDSEADFSIDRMVARKRDVIPFLLENARHLQMDITPLENLVRSQVSEVRIRARGMQLGVMTCKAPQMQGCPRRLSDMESGSLGDWILASAACFPVFPIKHIGGQRYLDGGYVDNLPIQMALEDGAESVVAVEVHPDHTHPEYARMPWLKTIKPLHTLGGFLDFDPKYMRRSRLMGHYDAMKAWNALDGHLYTFKRFNELSITAAARRFAFELARLDRLAQRQMVEGAPLMAALESETAMKALTWKDMYVRGLEMCARAMGFREDALYDGDQMIQRILNFARNVDLPEGLDEEGIREAERRGRRYLLAYLYRHLEKTGEYPGNMARRLCEMPMETSGALFLYNLKG